MWLFTRYGFYSIACARLNGKIDPDTVLIRGRRREHLEGLKKRFVQLSEMAIATTPNNDYRFRMAVLKETWIAVLAEIAAEQDWTNFKNEAARFQGAPGADYSDALHDVWSTMCKLQTRRRTL